MARSEIRGGQIKDDSVTGDDVDESTLIIQKLKDADGDTLVEVEQSSDEDKVRFTTDGSERMIILTDGKVGIGTSSPGYKLDVDGDIRVRGNDIRDNSGTKTISFDGSANVVIPNDLVASGTFASRIEVISGITNAIGASQFTILMNASSGHCKAQLPAVATCAGRIYNFKRIDNSANGVKIASNGSEEIDGSTNDLDLTNQYQSFTLQSDGSRWWIIADRNV